MGNGRSYRRRGNCKVLNDHVCRIGRLFVKTHNLQMLFGDIVQNSLGFFRPQSLFGIVAWSWKERVLNFVVNCKGASTILVVNRAATLALFQVLTKFGQCIESALVVSDLLKQFQLVNLR